VHGLNIFAMNLIALKLLFILNCVTFCIRRSAALSLANTVTNHCDFVVLPALYLLIPHVQSQRCESQL